MDMDARACCLEQINALIDMYTRQTEALIQYRQSIVEEQQPLEAVLIESVTTIAGVETVGVLGPVDPVQHSHTNLRIGFDLRKAVHKESAVVVPTAEEMERYRAAS